MFKNLSLFLFGLLWLGSAPAALAEEPLALTSKGLRYASADQAFVFQLRGYAQFDARRFLHNDGSAHNDVLDRRVRPIVEITAHKDFLFRLMPDFAGGRGRLFDAYLEYRYRPWLAIRAGKFKPPLGLERLQSGSALTFMERGLPTNLVPNRDIGLQLSGDLLQETLEYQLGVFTGGADLANVSSDPDTHGDLVARLFAHPLHAGPSWARELGIGLAGSLGDHEGSPGDSQLATYRTPGQQALFRYASPAHADGMAWRLAPQAEWYHGPAAMMAEYILSTQEVSRSGVSQALTHRAWQWQASYVLTGETNKKGVVSPREPFNPLGNAWGAFQIAGRIGQMEMDPDAFPLFANAAQSIRKADSAGAAINWYLNDNLSMDLNYDYTRFDGGASGGDRKDEHALLSRLQIKF